jgi:hypothetical protein
MSIQIAPHMARKRLVKDTQGNIIDWLDEADGGWIVRGRNIVNKERWEQEQQKEKDKKEAAMAIVKQKVDENAPDRTVTPAVAKENLAKASKQDERIDKMEEKLDAILKALNGK